MKKFFIDVCVGIMLCTAQVEPVKPATDVIQPSYNECKATLYTTDDKFVEVKPDSESIQESLVVRQCDHFTTQEEK